jgi:hypothetical protein
MSSRASSRHSQNPRDILSQHKRDITLLIGNGINRAAENGGATTWDGIIDRLISEELPEGGAARQMIEMLRPQHGEKPAASLPEIFDLLCSREPAPETLGANDPRVSRLQRRICELLAEMQPGGPHQAVTAWARANHVPLLTTNYDHCLQSAMRPMRCERRILATANRPLSDYYPWDRYYTPDELIDHPDRRFAIWHIHGDQALPRSLRVGLDQYMGMVQRLRKVIHAIARAALLPAEEQPAGAPETALAPWVGPFIGRKLWIQGLGLGLEEVPLRWLLIKRFQYRQLYGNREIGWSGWYIHGPTAFEKPGNIDPKHQAFLESVGIQTIEIKDPQDLYMGLFDQK